MEPEPHHSQPISHLTVKIHPFSTEDGGRKGPLISGEWRTVLGINDEHWSARLTFLGKPSPGETFIADVDLLILGAIVHFPSGSRFTVWEGGIKGTGVVVSRNLQPP